MKVIYVAGKLTGPNNFEISRNVCAAEDVAMEVVKLGAVPLIPHANTGLIFFGTATEDFWYEGTLELLRRCDAVLMVPGWEASKGAKLEFEEAGRRKIPIFTTPADLKAWLEKPPGDLPSPNTLRNFCYVVNGRQQNKEFDIRRTLGDIVDEILGDEAAWEYPEIRSSSGVLFNEYALFGEVDLPGRIFYIFPKAGYSG